MFTYACDVTNVVIIVIIIISGSSNIINTISHREGTSGQHLAELKTVEHQRKRRRTQPATSASANDIINSRLRTVLYSTLKSNIVS